MKKQMSTRDNSSKMEFLDNLFTGTQEVNKHHYDYQQMSDSNDKSTEKPRVDYQIGYVLLSIVIIIILLLSFVARFSLISMIGLMMLITSVITLVYFYEENNYSQKIKTYSKKLYSKITRRFRKKKNDDIDTEYELSNSYKLMEL